MPAALQTSSTCDEMKPGQKVYKTEKQGHDSIDSFIRQAIGKEPFFPFAKASESPVQWIQLLHALDQQGTNNVPNVSKVDNAIDRKEHSPEHSSGVSSFAYEKNGFKESTHAMKAGGLAVKGTKSTSEHIQSLKIPEAVVALAQAAAKANESEKYLPGWPLLSPLKVQMQRCEKCSREFCSSINYRRHIRVHRRPLNIDKDSTRYRESLGAFWDKISLDEAMEIASLKNASLEEVAGSSLIRALSSISRKPDFSSLPQAYVKAGDALLDIVQAVPSRFPISSQELYSVLDDASEMTFLCAGTATSVRKFVFDGEAGKICLEMKNLIACTSFLVEQKLVNAWLADMNAEALRRQKLLVEEEEANQKRQAELLEKKRLKKLRQKAQKGKDGDKGLLENAGAADSCSSAVLHADTALESNQNSPEAPAEQMQTYPESNFSLNVDMETRNRCCLKPNTANISAVTDSANDQNGIYGERAQTGNSQQQFSHWMVPKPLRNITNGSHPGQVVVRKYAIMQKQSSHREHQKGSSSVNGHKVWTRKTKSDNEGQGFDGNRRLQRESTVESEQTNDQKVLIGSICVNLESRLSECHDSISVMTSDQFVADIQSVRNDNSHERPFKHDLGPNSINRPMVKLWRPVGRHENQGDSLVVQGCERGNEMKAMPNRTVDRIPSNEIYLDLEAIADTSFGGSGKYLTELGEDVMGIRSFSNSAAEAFLSQRWKEAIAANHVKLDLSAETVLPEYPEIPDGSYLGILVAPPGDKKILGIAENWHPGLGPPVAAGSDKPKCSKVEKGCRLKYIPKQKNTA